MKKLLALAAVLASTFVATWAPSAQAIAYCSASYCANKPDEASCACPPESDRRGQSGLCGSWDSVGVGGCWYE